MVDYTRPKFFQASFEIQHNGHSLQLRGLISAAGITKIHVTNALPPFWLSLIGSVVDVKLDHVQLSGVLLQQFIEHGSFYEIKFRSLPQAMIDYLERRASTEGYSPGWQRKYPRIPVKGLDDPELPAPNLCMVRFVGQEIFVNVMNYTLGGIRVETLGDTLGELRVGSVLHFDLITTTGEVLDGLSAEVRNIAVHDYKGPEGTVLTRSFGLRFHPMSVANERKYRNLIYDFCTILKKRFEQEE